VLIEIVGVVAHIPNLAGAGVVLGIGAVLLSKVVRRRAYEGDDPTLASAGRWAQVLGWLAVGPIIAMVLLLVVIGAALVVIFR
jgi:hypothetical protein